MNQLSRFRRFLPPSWLFFGLLLVPAGQVAAVDVDSLLAASVGGFEAREQLSQVKSYRAVGKAVISGMAGTFEHLVMMPDRTYLRLDLPLFTLVQSYDQGQAWQQDHSGRISEVSGSELSELVKSLYFDTFSYLFADRQPGQIIYRGTEYLGEVGHHTIDLVISDQDTVTIWLETASGLMVRVKQGLDDLTAFQVHSDFRSVEGVLLPHHTSLKAVGAPLEMEFIYDSIQFDYPIASAMFAKPGSSPLTDDEFPDDRPMIEIPMEYHAGHIRVQAEIKGRPAWFILDSGASASMLDATFAAALGLEIGGHLPAKGIGGYEQVALVTVDSMQLGPLTLKDFTAGAVDLGQLLSGNESQGEFGGILGYDFLSRFPILIDYRQQVLQVFNPDDFRLPTGGTAIPFDLTLQIPTVAGNLVGSSGNFLIDLGNPFGLLLHHQFVRREALDKRLSDVLTLDEIVGGVGGMVGGRSAYASVFNLGEVMIKDLRVLMIDSAAGLAGSGDLAGNIGNLVLEKFKVLIDYGHSRLVLYPADNEQ